MRRQDAYYERGNVTEGPGAPDWQSALVESSDQHTDKSPSTQKLLTIMRCMLFAATSSSPHMSAFAAKVNEEDIDVYRCKAIDCLCRYGVDVDDEMLSVVTKASTLTPSSKIAVSVLDHAASLLHTAYLNRNYSDNREPTRVMWNETRRTYRELPARHSEGALRGHGVQTRF